MTGLAKAKGRHTGGGGGGDYAIRPSNPDQSPSMKNTNTYQLGCVDEYKWFKGSGN